LTNSALILYLGCAFPRLWQVLPYSTNNTKISTLDMYCIVLYSILGSKVGTALPLQVGLGNLYYYPSIAVVRCNAIYGISYRYHRCGTVCMLEDKGKCRESSLRMAFRIFRCHRAVKPTVVSLNTSFGDLKPT
jgi:hypothetical protein